MNSELLLPLLLASSTAGARPGSCPLQAHAVHAVEGVAHRIEEKLPFAHTHPHPEPSPASAAQPQQAQQAQAPPAPPPTLPSGTAEQRTGGWLSSAAPLFMALPTLPSWLLAVLPQQWGFRECYVAVVPSCRGATTHGQGGRGAQPAAGAPAARPAVNNTFIAFGSF